MDAPMPWENAQRVTAEVMRAKSRRAAEALRPLDPFFLGCCQALTAGLQSFTPSSVKCSVAQADIVRADTGLLQEAKSCFRTSTGDLHLYLRTTRNFEAFLCEICLGGAGLKPAEATDAARPASRLEALLKRQVTREIATRLPVAVQDTTEMVLEPIEEQTPKAGKVTSIEERCVLIEFLINVFSLSAEVEFLFPMAEVEAIFRTQLAGGRVDTRKVASVMGACEFTITALLKPQRIGLDQIVAMQPGTVLALDATPAHAATVEVDGQRIAQAQLKFQTGRMALVIS
jgi:flagellar motor switch protein FliM